ALREQTGAADIGFRHLQLRSRLVALGLVGSRVYREQQLPFFDVAALLEIDVRNDAGDARTDFSILDCLDAARQLNEDFSGRRLYRDDADRDFHVAAHALLLRFVTA